MKKLYQKFRLGLKVMLGQAEVAGYDDYEKYSCPLCEKDHVPFHPLPLFYFRNLDKYGFIHSIFQSETMNLEYYTCGACGANDRDRLYSLYIKKKLLQNTIPLKVLDIAPSAHLLQFMRSQPQLTIRTADLMMPDVDDKIDLTNMHIYENDQFDMFICSHVLEHISDDRAAMLELYRTLKPEGWGIVMVPINLGFIDNYENPLITDEAGRWKHFGQNDHVRFYSKQGFVERLQNVGFKVNQYDISFFGEDTFRKYAIHPRSVLYVVSK